MIIRVAPATLITQPLSYYVEADVIAQIVVMKYAIDKGLECDRNYLQNATAEDLTILKLQLPDYLDAKEFFLE